MTLSKSNSQPVFVSQFLAEPFLEVYHLIIYFLKERRLNVRTVVASCRLSKAVAMWSFCSFPWRLVAEGNRSGQEEPHTDGFHLGSCWVTFFGGGDSLLPGRLAAVEAALFCWSIGCRRHVDVPLVQMNPVEGGKRGLGKRQNVCRVQEPREAMRSGLSTSKTRREKTQSVQGNAFLTWPH